MDGQWEVSGRSMEGHGRSVRPEGTMTERMPPTAATEPSGKIETE